jgi:hypothetical protein
MLLHYDGFDRLWTEEDWLSLDPVYSDSSDEEITVKKRRLIPPERLQEYNLPTGEDNDPTIVENKHLELRAALISNLKYLWDKGDVEHLKFPRKTN